MDLFRNEGEVKRGKFLGNFTFMGKKKENLLVHFLKNVLKALSIFFYDANHGKTEVPFF